MAAAIARGSQRSYDIWPARPQHQDRTRHDRGCFTTAGPPAFESALDPRCKQLELGDPFAELAQPAFEVCSQSITARGGTHVGRRQESADLVERQPEVLRPSDEFDALDIRHVEGPVTVLMAVTRRYEASASIEAHDLRGNTRSAGKILD